MEHGCNRCRMTVVSSLLMLVVLTGCTSSMMQPVTPQPPETSRALVTFPGVWKARVAYDPICQGDPQTDEEIARWLSEMKPIGVIEDKVEAYSAPRRAQVRQAVADFRAGNVSSERMAAADYRDIAGQ